MDIETIALLHFLKSLEDTKFALASGIVVIDDPVCSMNDTACSMLSATSRKGRRRRSNFSS